jgi:DNA primase
MQLYFNLIDLIDENPSTSINKAYNILKQKRNNMNEFKKIIRVWEIEVALKMEEEISKQSRNKNLKNLNKSLSRDNTDYFYLKEEGFHYTDFLARNDVAFKDDKKHEISEINKFINRICYIIRNIEGDIVGIQGRSVLSNITKKEKVMNTWDSKSGTHFYLLHQFVNNKKINKVIITEGPKDALRIKESVEKNNLNNIAIISSLGCFMSQAQFYLLSKVFNKKVEICLAFDVDDNGKKGTIHAAKRLKERGFENITFVFPPCFRDDWGELTTRKEQDQIVDSIKNTIKVTMENYENEEDKRGEQRNKEILDRIRQDIRKAFLVNIHRNK